MSGWIVASLLGGMMLGVFVGGLAVMFGSECDRGLRCRECFGRLPLDTGDVTTAAPTAEPPTP